MKTTKMIIFCVLALTSTAVPSIAQGYRGIVPLHSTCEDVKRTLGVTTCHPLDDTYELQDEKMRIIFSKQPCEKAWQKLWNVSPGTVMSIERFLKKHIMIADLNVDLSKYEKKVLTDNLNEALFVSKDGGLEFRAVDERVTWIVYTPKPEDNYLLCREQPDFSQNNKKIELPTNWFDRYGNLPFSAEKERLDYLARELQEYPPTTQILIVAYSVQLSCKGKTQGHASRAKNYLVRTYSIAPNRIRIIDGGRGKKFKTVLYIVTPNSP